MNLDELIERLLQLRREEGHGRHPVTLKVAAVGTARVTKVTIPETMGYSKPGERYVVIS